MITTGSRIFYGMAGAALLAAILYGIITNGLDAGGVTTVLSGDGAVDAVVGPLTFGYKGGVGEHIGYTLLMGFAGTTLAFGLMTTAFRDNDADAVAAATGVEHVGPVTLRPGPGFWPPVAAFGAALLAVGLVTQWITFVLGLVVVVVAGIEWTISAWAEQLSGDQEANRRHRNALMGPIEVPVAAVAGIGIVVYCFSRIFLAVSKNGSVWIAIGLAGVIFVVAVLLSTRERFTRGMIAGVAVVAALVVLALGISGGVAGSRDFEEHHSEEGAVPASVTNPLGAFE